MRAFCGVCLLGLLLSGCGTPKDRFYVLGAPPGPTPEPSAMSYTVAIGSIGLPELVNRSQMVLHQPDNRVEIMEHERWAEPLNAAIPATIVRELRTQLPDALVAAYPQRVAVEAECQINIDIQRFESRRGDSALLEGLWAVRCGKSAPRLGRSLIRETVQDNSYSALAAAYGKALAKMSKELADSVKAARAKP